MNRDGAEVLVRAALDGVKQIRMKLWDGKGGYCAMGVLIMAAATERNQGDALCAVVDLEGMMVGDIYQLVRDRYAISEDEHKLIVYANNYEEWDFLTIARKFEAQEAPA